MSSERHAGVKERIVAEATQFLIVFAYVWALLAIFGLHKSLVLSEVHIVERQGLIVLKALAFAKIIFVAEEMKLGENFDARPLIWPMLLKSALFSVLLIGFDMPEQAIVDHFWPRVAAANSDEMKLDHLHTELLAAALSFAALVPFFGMRELSKVIGEGRMYELMFLRRRRFEPVPDPPDRERYRSLDETPE